jgi:hypothetical protein
MSREHLSEGDVEQIRELRSRRVPLKTVAAQFGITVRQVTRITSGKAWRFGFNPTPGTMTAVERFQQDRGWSNCPFDAAKRPCDCWEQERPEDHCTNAPWRTMVLAAIAAGPPGERPAATRERCHTMA